MKPYSLFIDDIRTPKTVAPVGNWVITRTYFQVLQALAKQGVPDFISFDHELGESCDAIQVAKLFVKLDQDHIEKHGTPFLPTHFSFEVHSAKSETSGNVRPLLDNYLSFRKKYLIKNVL